MVTRPSFEWTIYDSKKQDFKLVRASSQKEAVLKAVERHGFVARHTNDARPRTGDAELMEEERYDAWLETHINL